MIRIPAATSGPDGFVSLFNGKDLTGWHTGERSPGRWRVDGGVLIGDEGPGFLFSDGEYYHDFHLRVEARVNAGGNGGVNFLDSLRAEISGNPKTPSGSLVRLADKKAVSFTPYPHGIAPADTWFTMEIRAGGPKVEVRVNDLPWTTAAANHGFRPHRIHLEATAGTVVEFKRIEVKDLPARRRDPHLQQRGSRRLKGDWVVSFGSARRQAAAPEEFRGNGTSDSRTDAFESPPGRIAARSRHLRNRRGEEATLLDLRDERHSRPLLLPVRPAAG